MKLEVLLSAMHLKSFEYIDTLNIKTDCIVVNQCNTNKIADIEDNNRFIKYISTNERGLSKSRNMAIKNAKADICILCDNDVEYVPNYNKIITDKFKEYPQFDIIIFHIKRNRPGSRPYFDCVKKMGYYSTLKVFSPEIAFRREALERKGIKFKELFGAGAKYSMGEENIFLYECLKKGLRILYVPEKIANLREEESTWFKGFNEKYFVDRGAIFFEMSNMFSIPLIIQFAIRKRKLYCRDFKMKDAIKYMLKGRGQYRNEISK